MSREPKLRFLRKVLAQQDIQSIHRSRDLLMKHRATYANQMRGLLAEYEVIIPQGIRHIRTQLAEILETENNVKVVLRYQ